MGFGGFRRKNIFPSYGEPEPSEFDPSGINKRAFGVQPFGSSYYPREIIQQDDDYESDYTPSSSMRRYLDLIGSTPKREEYQPTKTGRVLAALGGAAEGYKGGAAKGVQTALGIRDLPYTRALEEHETELGNVAAGLRSEQQEQQLRSLAGYRAGTLSEKAAERVRKEAYDKARAELGQKKEEGLNIRFGEEIKVKRADQAARERHYEEMDRINDAYKKGLISESEKNRQLEGELGRERNRIMGITAQAATTRAGAAVTAAEAAKTKAEKTGAEKTPKPITPAAQNQAHSLAVKRVYEDNPDWAKYFDKKGNLKAARTLLGFGPVDMAEYNKVKEAVSSWEKRILAQMPAAVPAQEEAEEVEEEVDY